MIEPDAPLTEAEIARLIQVLCVDFGFCLTVDEAHKLETNPPRTVDAFTRAVFLADGQDPSQAGTDFYKHVERAVADSFRRISPTPQKRDPSASTSIFDAAEIRAAERSWVELLEDPDVSKRAYGYTEDATLCMSGAAVIQGRQEMLRRPMKPLFSVSINPHATEGHGNLAYVYGDFSFFTGRTASSAGTRTDLRFLIVWRKQEDGVWRIAKEFLNHP